MNKFGLPMLLCRAVICVTSALFILSSQAGPVPENDLPHSVCDVIQKAKEYDGQLVLIESTVVASEHATVLEGQLCGKAISLSYSVGHSGAKWKALDDAIAAKSSVLDKRVLRIKVRGVYHDAVQIYKRSIRQLEVTEVLDVEFEDRKEPLAGAASSPSAQTSIYEPGHVDPPSPH
jgi:hypothetical protein